MIKLEEYLHSDKKAKDFINESYIGKDIIEELKIDPKKEIREEFRQKVKQLKENGGSKSCVMLDLQQEKNYQLYWLKQKIPIENIYSHKPILTMENRSMEFPIVGANSPNEDLGYEEKEHCTVFYGLNDDADLFKIKKYCLENYPNSFTLQTDYIHIFENVEKGECDCVIIKCKPCKELIEINKYIKENFSNTQTYNDYIPHITLAYIKKGTCRDLLNISIDILFRVSVNDFIYSGHDKVLMESN